MIFIISRGKLIQVSVSFLACIMSYFSGIYVGWTSPMTTYFSANSTKLQSGPMTTEEISLVSSMAYIGAVLGALLSGLLVNIIGRKWSQLVWLFPVIVGNTLAVVAEGPLLLFISRLLCGTIGGAALVVPSIFVAEIVEDSLKTTTGTLNGVMFNLGIFFCKFLTGMFGIYSILIVSIPIILICHGCLLMCPDTPEYLLFRNRINEAEKSLKFYRGLPSDKPLPESNALEFEEMKKQVSLRSENTTSISLKDFGESTTILAVIVSFVLTGTLNFGGVRITTSFTEAMVKDTGILINLSLVDTAISSLQIVGCLTSIYITRRLGNRLSLLICYCLGFLGLLGTGIHYFLHQTGHDLNPLTWSFVVFLTISIVVPSTGLHNISQSVAAMILPLKIRGSVLGTFNVLQLVLATFAMHYYLYLSQTIGNFTIFIVFSTWCFFGAIFTYFFIPEVNNLTYAEIVSALNEKLPQKFRSLI